MNSAHLDRLAIFAQHGQPKDYGGSDMMRADLTALVSALAASGAPQEAPGDAPSDKLDAKRYRWLREYAPSLLAEIWNDDSYISRPEDLKLGEAKLWLDHLIDAAMKGPQ